MQSGKPSANELSSVRPLQHAFLRMERLMGIALRLNPSYSLRSKGTSLRERATYDVPSIRVPPNSQDPITPVRVIRCRMDSHLLRKATTEGANSSRGTAEAAACNHRIESDTGGCGQYDARTVAM